MVIEKPNSGRKWAEKARLVDSRASVQDVEFAPRHLGLKFVGVFIYSLEDSVD